MSSPRTPPLPEQESELELAERTTTEGPRQYQVVFHNDDYTPMDFVVLAITRFFHRGETEATQIMLQVHHRGYGIVGQFSRDVAETKAEQVMAFARAHGHPLRCTAEPLGATE